MIAPVIGDLSVDLQQAANKNANELELACLGRRLIGRREFRRFLQENSTDRLAKVVDISSPGWILTRDGS